MKTESTDIYDVIGIGIGPSNLSTAALLHPVQDYRSCFLDSREGFDWHPGMLFPEATLQVSYLKDLVTLIDPTNPYSFLAFLSKTNRLYRFITSRFPRVKRREFNQYFQWVCGQLGNLHFSTTVSDVKFTGDCFRVHHSNGVSCAKNLIIAAGLTPKIPAFAVPYKGETVFHAIHYRSSNIDVRNRSIAVVGGGQSGAEVLMQILLAPEPPSKITWITKRDNLSPIDDSPFANEYFTPAYSDYFFKLPAQERHKLLEKQTLASDGIDLVLLEEIYRKFYELEFIDKKGKIFSLMPSTSLAGMKREADHWKLEINSALAFNGNSVDADIVIFATGFEFHIPEFLTPLMDRIPVHEDRFVVREDFSIEWDGPAENRIFLQNGARHVRGVADPNLSLLAWRSAKIINSLTNSKVYDLGPDHPVFEWPEAVNKNQEETWKEEFPG